MEEFWRQKCPLATFFSMTPEWFLNKNLEIFHKIFPSINLKPYLSKSSNYTPGHLEITNLQKLDFCPKKFSHIKWTSFQNDPPLTEIFDVKNYDPLKCAHFNLETSAFKIIIFIQISQERSQFVWYNNSSKWCINEINWHVERLVLIIFLMLFFIFFILFKTL